MVFKWFMLVIALAHGSLWSAVDKKMTAGESINKEIKMSKVEIEKLLSSYEECLNTSNAKKAADLYTETGVFMPSNAPTAAGKAGLLGAYEFVFKNIQLKIRFKILEIEVSGDMAFAVTQSEGTSLIHASGQTVPEANREIFILQKENEKWKIARYMFNKSK